MLSKQQIIEETVEYYKNNPFGFDSTKYDGIGGCVYYGPEGQMCAVGRCLINPKHFATNTDSAYSLINDLSDDILEEKYRGHSSAFWQSLQSFHDDCAKNLFKLENYKTHRALGEYYDRQEA